MKPETVHEVVHEIPGDTCFGRDTHPAVRGKKYENIYASNKDFVKFTKTWKKSTGSYNLWAKYVKQQNE
jgi:hypothetical protein